MHKKRSFPLRISSVNVTKFAVSCGFVTFTEEILTGKLHFCCSVIKISETLLGPYQTSLIELFGENSKQLKAVNYFLKMAPPKIASPKYL